MQRKVYNYKRADFEALRNRLQLNTLDMSVSDDADLYWFRWKALFLAAVEKCVPVKVIKDTNSPPWIDGEIRHLLRKKYRALKKYRENRTEQRKRKLRSLSNDIKILVRHKHRDYLNKIVGSFCENPKLFWSYHKAVLHHRSGVDSVITHNGQTAKTSGEKAELFNTYFCSVFTSPNTVPSTMPSNPNRSYVEISDVQLSVEEVELCLAGLD